MINIKSGIVNLLSRLKTAEGRKQFVRGIVFFGPHTLRVLYLFSTFFLLLVLTVSQELIRWFTHLPVIGLFFKPVDLIWKRTAGPVFDRFMTVLDNQRSFKVRRSYLIYVAMQNLLARKSRSFVTILGMSIGVGIIVYLLSLGYGVERLVIGQVVSLDELSQVDVVGGETTTSKIDASALDKISKIPGVKLAMPIVSVVGRLNYQNAKVDVVVNAVPPEFFSAGRNNLVTGKYFSFDVLSPEAGSGVVAGAQTSLIHSRLGYPVTGNRLFFNILPEEEVAVWESCSIGGKTLGSTKRLEGGFEGIEKWGNSYSPFEPYGRQGYDDKSGRYTGKWVEAKVPLYLNDTDGNLIPSIDESGRQLWAKGCIPRKNVQVTDEFLFASVLGEATASAQVDKAATEGASLDLDTSFVSTDSAGFEIVKIASEQQSVSVSSAPASLTFRGKPSGKAIISTGLLKLLNIPIEKALTTSFKTSFIITRSLMPEVRTKSFTEEVEYKVSGVVRDDDKQFIYVPFADMQSLGIPYYSQAKTIMNNKDQLPQVREEIETLGFTTSSAVDTVAQIERLFVNLKVILVMIGLIALGVAALGMFNTLTVSLLERTREIGGMKTIGMVMSEIQDLFLAEAMIMGFAGGIGGLTLGYLGGKLTSMLISIVAISNGIGYLELTYVPSFLVFFILGCSFVIGLLTGLYPAFRAKKISALNALRYE